MVESNPKIGVVVLAGGGVPATLSQFCTHRALLRLNDRYLLDYQLETLGKISSVIQTVVVVPEEAIGALAALPGLKISAGETIVENMRNGVRALAAHAPTHFLFLTGDVPLVTREGLEGYIHASIESNAALTYPIIPRAASERRFPGARRTYVTIKEGTFTGGNAIFTQADILDDKHMLIQELYDARKNPIRLARILGWTVVLRMLTGTLRLAYLESVATRILDAPVRAIITEHAEIGFDVDKADDLLAVEQASFRSATAHGAG